MLCGRATWSGAVKVYIEQGEQAAREWLRTTGYKNIDDLNKVLKQLQHLGKQNNLGEVIHMNREEVQLLGFEIVAYAGDARSKLLEALNAANEGDFDKAEQLTEEEMNVLQMPIKLKQTYWLKKRKVMTLHLVLQ